MLHNLINKQLLTRKKKLNLLKKYGFNFPNKFKKTNSIINLINNYLHYNRDKLALLKIKVNIGGRIYNKRVMSKNSIFMDIQENNKKIQLYVHKKYLITNNFINNFKLLDLGDIIGIKGILFKTHTNELSIKVTALFLLTKCLKSLPDKYHKLINKETCIRKRYLDLLINTPSKIVLETRIKIIKLIRLFLQQKGFVEVDTPILHPIVGGAIAKPFSTFHHDLNMKMYLRIAPELYLKKLIVGGFNKIFEIGKNFRNEGISTIHNPEFTMLELYVTYENMNYLIELLQKLILFLINKLHFNKNFSYNNIILNFTTPFNKKSMIEAIIDHFNINSNFNFFDYKEVLQLTKKIKLTTIDNKHCVGELIETIFSKLIVKTLIQPTIIHSYPTEISPLSRCNDQNHKIVDRFELFIAGNEIANGFSELNDAEMQSKRFIKLLKNQGLINKLDKYYDKDYIEALEYGLPPTAGLGIGLDRLIMILTNKLNIRDVIFFPILKPKN